uniref:Vesicle-associated membrane protein/synaptobrevin-binding protein n=1 Tax=Aegilops tauschii TaxID=37682 RepID=M8BMJ8_AEGTA
MGSDSKELLGIEPLELRFPFEFMKQISCSMELTNRTDDYLAFKVKTTSPKKYCVRPNSGIVPPRSTSSVVVTMQALKQAPPDMQCKDKFLVQSAVVTEGTAVKDITGEMMQATRESDEPPLSSVSILTSSAVFLAHKEPSEITTETSPLISRLTEERNSAIQQNNKLREELDLVRREISKQNGNGGFPLVFVVAVALLGILLGYLMKR